MNSEEAINLLGDPAEPPIRSTATTTQERTPWWAILILVLRIASYALLATLTAFLSYEGYTKDVLVSVITVTVLLFILMKMRNPKSISRAKVFEHAALGSLPYMLIYALIFVFLLAVTIQSLLFTYQNRQDLKFLISSAMESHRANERGGKIMLEKGPVALNKFLDSDAFKHNLIEDQDDLKRLALGYAKWARNISPTQAEKLFHRVYSRLAKDSLQMAHPHLPEKFRTKQFAVEFPQQVYDKAPGRAKSIAMDFFEELVKIQEEAHANLTKKLKSTEPGALIKGGDFGSLISPWIIDFMRFPFWFMITLFQQLFLYVVCVKNQSLIYASVKDICILSACASLAFLPLGFRYKHGFVPFILQTLQNLLCGWWIGCVVARSRNIGESQSSPIAMVLLIAATFAYANSISNLILRTVVLIMVAGCFGRYYIFVKQHHRIRQD